MTGLVLCILGKKKADKGTKIIDRGTKRSSDDDSSQNIDKKQKLISGGKSNNGVGEIISPRRSSRTSIPNSRYRDMEEEPPSRRKKSGTVSSRYLTVENQRKLLISQSKFSVPRKFTLRYQ